MNDISTQAGEQMAGASDKIVKFRRDILKIIWQAIESVNPENAINKHFRLQYENLIIDDRKINISDFKNIYVIGAGKASTQMAKAIENILMRRLTGGLICTKAGHGVPLHSVNVMEAGHPVPNKESVLAAQRAIQLVTKCEKEDLIICLLSGGASSLWCVPFPPLTFEDKVTTTQALLKSGADIHEINAFRKHISNIKGGRLAQAAHPATMITLAISDVVGDEISSIGSGPTVGDPTTFKQVFDTLDKYKLSRKLPLSVLDHIWNGYKKVIKETPRPTDAIFGKNVASVIASNAQALDTAMETGRYLGYKTYILSSKITGEASTVGIKHVEKIKDMIKSRRPGDPPIMLLAGGETTVTVKGKGKGGRNQELILAAATALDGLGDAVMASVGTDGIDGFTDAAGAFADSTTITRGKEKGLDAQKYLDNNNSYEYFSHIGDLIKTGPTGTNVMDIQVLIYG
jgi:glycerate 2-kinase